MESRHRLYGSYYFISNEKVEHSRMAFNITGLLAALGGLSSLMVAVAKGAGSYFQHQYIIAKFIKSLYFIEIPKFKTIHVFGMSLNLMSDTKIKFTMGETILTNMKWLYYSIKKPDHRICEEYTKGQQLLLKGTERVYNDLSLITIVQSIQKLKAVCSVLADHVNHTGLQDEIKDLYYTNNLI